MVESEESDEEDVYLITEHPIFCSGHNILRSHA